MRQWGQRLRPPTPWHPPRARVVVCPRSCCFFVLFFLPEGGRGGGAGACWATRRDAPLRRARSVVGVVVGGRRSAGPLPTRANGRRGGLWPTGACGLVGAAAASGSSRCGGWVGRGEAKREAGGVRGWGGRGGVQADRVDGDAGRVRGRAAAVGPGRRCFVAGRVRDLVWLRESGLCSQTGRGAGEGRGRASAAKRIGGRLPGQGSTLQCRVGFWTCRRSGRVIQGSAWLWCQPVSLRGIIPDDRRD